MCSQRLGSNDDHTYMSYMRLAVVICQFKSFVFILEMNLIQYSLHWLIYFSDKILLVYKIWLLIYLIHNKNKTYFLNFYPNLKQCAVNNFNVSGTCTKYVYCYSKCGVVLPLIVLLWAAIASLLTFSIYLPFVSTIDLLILWLSD